MTVLVVGSVALDSVETPFGKATDVLGGSGTFFSAAASHLAPVQLVVPEDVVVKTVNLALELETLSYALASR